MKELKGPEVSYEIALLLPFRRSHETNQHWLTRLQLCQEAFLPGFYCCFYMCIIIIVIVVVIIVIIIVLFIFKN